MKPTLADTFAVRSRNDHGPRKTGFLALAESLLTGKACGIILPLVLYIPLVIIAGAAQGYCVAHNIRPDAGVRAIVPWLPVPLELWVIGRLLFRDVALGLMNLVFDAILTQVGIMYASFSFFPAGWN